MVTTLDTYDVEITVVRPKPYEMSDQDLAGVIFDVFFPDDLTAGEEFTLDFKIANNGRAKAMYKVYLLDLNDAIENAVSSGLAWMTNNFIVLESGGEYSFSVPLKVKSTFEGKMKLRISLKGEPAQ